MKAAVSPRSTLPFFSRVAVRASAASQVTDPSLPTYRNERGPGGSVGLVADGTHADAAMAVSATTANSRELWIVWVMTPPRCYLGPSAGRPLARGLPATP